MTNSRQEAVKVLYKEDGPIAVILNGEKPPRVYRLTLLNVDELANLFANGDPDEESPLMSQV